MGAVDAVFFSLPDIVFDSRTLLKCMFGCPDWGKLHTCPSRPGSPTMGEYREMFSLYKWGIVVHTHDKRSAQKISYELERKAYFAGYPFAFSLSDCAVCDICAGRSGEPCRDPKKARPAFHSVGIDVYATVHKMGLPLEPLRSDGQQENWYAAVFME